MDEYYQRKYARLLIERGVNLHPNQLLYVETVLDEAVFLKQGQIALHKGVDEIREETGMSVDGYFREVFKC